jgi:hypothetical protein
MSKPDRLAPKARKSELIVKEMADEVLVYDENNNKAHCLNQTAALVWKHCDGRSTIPKITRRLTKEMNRPVSEKLVWLALKQLEDSRLLETSAPVWIKQTSRRELVRRIGIAAVALPIISSMTTANAVAAASCRSVGQSCVGVGQGTCCQGLSCCTPSNTCFAGGCP